MRLAPCCSALAARAGTRQVEATLRADRAAAAVQRASLPIWRALLILAKGGQYSRQQAHRLAQALPRILAGEVVRQSRATAAWGWKSATATVRGSVPRAVLARAALRRNMRAYAPKYAHMRVKEALDFDDPLAAFRDGEYAAADLDALLFPPPSQDLLDRVVFATGWAERLASGTGLGDPQTIADTISNGLAGGQSQQQIATALRPLVQGVVSSAKRVARTEGLRVASAVQMVAHEQLGDLVAGWQIHATLDERTRPEHAARNGTIYWIHPKAGQLGTDQMPHPPHEADGSLAWSCRCFLTPVLREPDEPGVFDPGVFDPSQLTPSPAVYADWWGKRTRGVGLWPWGLAGWRRFSRWRRSRSGSTSSTRRLAPCCRWIYSRGSPRRTARPGWSRVERPPGGHASRSRQSARRARGAGCERNDHRPAGEGH